MSQRLSNYPVISNSSGEQTNPGTSTVMADTGTLDVTSGCGGGGVYEILVLASASAAADFVLQRRNTTNASNVGSTFGFFVPAGQTVTIPWRSDIVLGERLRVMMASALTGTAVVSICVQRVS